MREKENEAEATLREIDQLKDVKEAEPVYREIKVQVDPRYKALTNQYIMLTHYIQTQLNKSKELARLVKGYSWFWEIRITYQKFSEIKELSGWSSKLENLVLEENELDFELTKAYSTIKQLDGDDELRKIYDQIDSLWTFIIFCTKYTYIFLFLVMWVFSLEWKIWSYGVVYPPLSIT